MLVVGCGHIGETMANALEEFGYAVVRIDPKHNDNKISDYIHMNDLGAVVSVPTPTVDGLCDDSIVREVLEELGDTPVLLKSTVLPDIVESYADNVVYSPEFLRTSEKDFDNQEVCILGGIPDNTTMWKNILSSMNVEFIETDRHTASMVKYVHNSWLATKVAFFHELLNITTDKNLIQPKRLGKHQRVIDILARFENIGPSHMTAPNDEGSLGFGGECFPKDTLAFLHYTDSEILQKVIEVNSKLKEVEWK
jgi:UDP-glucose 6-dehydrogenase